MTSAERYVARGKNPQDDPTIVKTILFNSKERILANGNLRPPSDDIWKSLIEEYGLHKTPKALYTFVACDKWGIKLELGMLKQKHSAELGLEEEEQEEPNLDESHQKEYLDPEEIQVPNTSKRHYKIFIAKEKWKIMEPQELVYWRKTANKGPLRASNEGKYLALKPGIWSEVINTIIWDTTKWPCSWSYKGNYIGTSENARYWLAIRGRCGCGNELLLYSVNKPEVDPISIGLSLDLDIWGDKDNHQKAEGVRKRPCTGEKRRDLGAEMLDRNVKASRVRKEMASSIMDVGDPYPAHLPTNEVVRQIKSQAQNCRRVDINPLMAVQLMKYSSNPAYQYAIKEIGLDPFFVHLCTPDQIKVYNMYCSSQYSRLIVDASGKLVRKIPIPGNSMSGHIFLYLGVVRITGEGEGLIPVVQMLSERHNSNALTYWLAEWVRGGASIPSEVVTDDSAALISAACKAFAGEPNTATYLSHCLQFLQGNADLKPTCLIRLDIAHFTNMVRKWPEIVQMSRRAKEFYIRVIVLVAKASSLEEARAILRAIFVVSLSETEGNSVSNGQPTMCEREKKMLLAMISGISVNVDDFNRSDVESTPEDGRTGGHCEEPVESQIIEGPSNMKEWVNDIKREVGEKNKDDGDRDNIMFSPRIMKKIKKLCYIFPLWCTALAHKMNSPFSRSVGAYVEGEFSNIKNNLIVKDLRVDDFIREYLTLCDGAIKLASTMSSVTASTSQRLEERSTVRALENPSSTENETQPIITSTSKPAYAYCADINSPLCPACSNNDLPGGAHKCKRCCKPVHVLDECSFPVNPEDEGYGESRICVECSSIQRDQVIKDLITKTGIVDRPDITLPGRSKVELTTVEGWKGKSLPPKKRKPAFYWRPSPDFPMLQLTKKCAKIGLLKNGHNPSLKVLKVGHNKVLLSNTCSFDAPCQLFATAYCDSPLYKEQIDKLSEEMSILQVAKHIVVASINRVAYQMRANILRDVISPTLLKGGVIKLDCSMDSSTLLRVMKILPSVQEVFQCSSPHCPASITKNNIVVISATVSPQQQDLKGLQEALTTSDPPNESHCLQTMSEVDGVPSEYFIVDETLSEKGPVCLGSRTRKVEVGPHLIIELISSEQRLHTGGADVPGVLKAVNISLDGLPRTLQYAGVLFTLRGVIAFTPPANDNYSGHYRALTLRKDLSWEVYDDLRDKVSFLSKDTEVNVHTLLFTV